MKLESWYLIFGALLVVIALTASAVRRWPLTTTMLYLLTGVVLGPLGFGVASIHSLDQARLLERAAELVVIVSLFSAGLKLRAPFQDGKWKVPVRLAFVSMAVTVGLIALVGVYGLGLPLGAAVLLGAVLAPTDPVLASDVQLESAADQNRLRFNLTGEAGLNDGTAFPFVMLGVGWLGLHELGDGGWRWFAVDVLWAIGGGVTIGTLFGIAVGHSVLYLRRKHKAGLGREEFLTLGLIGLSYGAALLAHTYGFLAVFAAGLALRGMEQRHTDQSPTSNANANANVAPKSDPETHPQTAPAYLTESVLNFNEQLERILEVGLVLVIGIMLAPEFLDLADLWFVPVLLLIIRPMAVGLGLAGLGIPRPQISLLSWFGIRGIGSLYYLMYGIGLGIAPDISRQLISVTLWVIAVSIVIHGISVTPLMNWYQAKRRGRVAG
jgi:NhaP-type Na+/H+ or K+/H+ antiporter